MKLISVTSPIGTPIDINADQIVSIREVLPGEAHKYARALISVGNDKIFVRETVGEVIARVEAMK